MKTYDPSTQFVIYNLVIGVLLVIASHRLGSYAGALAMGRSPSVERYARLTVKAFGSSVAVLSGSILVLFHILRIGVE